MENELIERVSTITTNTPFGWRKQTFSFIKAFFSIGLCMPDRSETSTAEQKYVMAKNGEIEPQMWKLTLILMF